MKKILLSCILLLQISCGSSQDSNSSKEESSEPFPAFASSADGGSTTKTFSFKTSEIEFSCTDGGLGAIPKIALILSITVVQNTITILSKDESGTVKAEASGVQIEKISGFSGVIENDGSFIASQTATGKHETYGTLSMSYHLEGVLSRSEWHGNYEFTLLFDEYYLSCTYTSTFSGVQMN